MKRFPPSLLFVSLVLAGIGAHAETVVQQLVTQAQAEYRKGDIAAAKRDFGTVTQLDPRNQVAINFLKQITAQEKLGTGNTPLERQVSGLIVPKIEYKEATLDSVLDSLKRIAAKVSDDKVAVNFVPAIPEEQLRQQTVTLTLSNVPFTEVLKYIGNLTNVRFTYEKYAIVVKPAATSASATPVANSAEGGPK